MSDYTITFFPLTHWVVFSMFFLTFCKGIIDAGMDNVEDMSGKVSSPFYKLRQWVGQTHWPSWLPFLAGSHQNVASCVSVQTFYKMMFISRSCSPWFDSVWFGPWLGWMQDIGVNDVRCRSVISQCIAERFWTITVTHLWTVWLEKSKGDQKLKRNLRLRRKRRTQPVSPFYAVWPVALFLLRIRSAHLDLARDFPRNSDLWPRGKENLGLPRIFQV